MKKILSVAAATALLSGAAFAVEADNIGNYLVTPAFYSTSGYETKISVVNPSDTNSIVAKVVIREGKCSNEVRDFLIFLTPGDKFDASIVADGTGSRILTTDDSVRDQFPTAGEPLPGTTYGYVEVFALAEYNSTIYTGFAPGVQQDKAVLEAAYDASTLGLTPFTDNLFTGTVSLVNSDNNLGMTVPMTAVEIASLPGNKFGQETKNTTYGDVLTNPANVATLMDALKKTSVMMPYTAGQESVLNLAFINKSAYLPCLTGGVTQPIEYTGHIRDNEENKYQTVGGIFSGVDPDDPNTVQTELSQIAIADLVAPSGFSAGWLHIDIEDFSDSIGDANISGTPVVPSLMQVIATGGGNVTNMFLPAYK